MTMTGEIALEKGDLKFRAYAAVFNLDYSGSRMKLVDKVEFLIFSIFINAYFMEKCAGNAKAEK